MGNLCDPKINQDRFPARRRSKFSLSLGFERSETVSHSGKYRKMRDLQRNQISVG